MRAGSVLLRRYRLVYEPIPRVSSDSVNLYGFLKSIGCEDEFSKIESFKQLVKIRYKPRSTEELKKLSIGVKPRKKIIQAMEDYRQGIMPNLYGRFSDASPDDGQK